MKRILLLAAILIIFPMVSALSSVDILNPTQTEPNYDLNWYSTTWDQLNPDNNTFTPHYFQYSSASSLDTPYLLLKVYANSTGPVDLSIMCENKLDSNFTFYNTVSVGGLAPMTALIPLDQLSGSSIPIVILCNLSIAGDATSAPITAYLLPKTELLPSWFKVPSTSVSNFVSTVDDIMSGAFNLFKLMILITMLVTFGFIIIFTWKILAYLVGRLRL